MKLNYQILANKVIEKTEQSNNDIQDIFDCKRVKAHNIMKEIKEFAKKEAIDTKTFVYATIPNEVLLDYLGLDEDKLIKRLGKQVSLKKKINQLQELMG